MPSHLQGIDWLVDGLSDVPAGAEGIVPGGRGSAGHAHNSSGWVLIICCML